jgi:GTPase SAR1 family protein
VYDVTKRNTFENLDDYMTKIRNNTYNNVPVVLIGNKSCSEVREVTTEEGEEYAAKHNIEFWETDAKDSKNVDRAFLRAAELVYMKKYESKYTEITEADKIIQTGKTVAIEQCTIQ